MKLTHLVIATALTTTLPGANAASHQGSEQTSKEENRGLIAGLVVGASVGGPFGAGVGAIVGGGLIGKALATNRIKNELQTSVARLATEREELEQTVAMLNGDLDRMVQRHSASWQHRAIPLQFRTGSAHIEAHYEGQLTKIAGVLNRNPDATISLSGFTDRRGDEDANQRLSEERVAAVKQYLMARGVTRGQILGRAYGEKQPLRPDESLESNFFDRRVVLELTLDHASKLATR
ncbi:MAG: sortase-associated OmpA-like protein PdsO [Proteobacteria bacterium]|nr:sortase-associated OmpA-like protein PdsO [Pseudomonadota bacterium]MDA1301575.1 sortase-associated OmpA-like protein PdsO [Pseudomonadota bacterium]